MESPKKQTVRNRLVFYVPGFDPMPPNRYRELYQTESHKQSEISNYEIDVKRISSLEKISRFEVKSNINSQQTNAEIRFLQWNDLVHSQMHVPIWKSWLGMLNVGRVIAFSGALMRLIKLHFPPNIAGLYPFFMIPAQIFLALIIALTLTNLALDTIPTSMRIFAWIYGAAAFAWIVRFWRMRDHKLLAYYMLHDLMFICQNDGYTPSSLRDRFEQFKDMIAQAKDCDFDEILIVGHSSGAHMAVIILAELIREGRISKTDNVSLLTLGQAIPLVSYLPKASDLRLALKELAIQDVAPWVDFTAPSDGASFALHDPVSSSVKIDEEPNYPRVLSAAFRQSLSDEYYSNLRMRFFRLHFQYLCHFDRPGIYDYFQITAGPQRLWERFGGMKNSPSTNRDNFNKFESFSK